MPPGEIAVIIVTYQSCDYIRACLTSLPHAEPHRRLAIFVIDNASSDGTPELIAQLSNEISSHRIGVTFIRNQQNAGFTCAVNQGLALIPQNATVLFLNPDTELPAMSLAALLEKLYARDEVGVVAPQLRFMPNALKNSPAQEISSIQPSCRRFPAYRDLAFELTGLSRLFPHSGIFNRWKMGEFDHRSSREVDQPQGACLLARPEVVHEVGKWDERFPLFLSDVDWCRRVRQAGWKIRFEPEVFIWHARGASVKQVRPRSLWSSHLSFWQYFRKWRSSVKDEIYSFIAAPLLILAALVRIAGYYLSSVWYKVKDKV